MLIASSVASPLRSRLTGPESRPYAPPYGIIRHLVGRAAWYPARHGIPRGTVSHAARYPAQHGYPHGWGIVIPCDVLSQLIARSPVALGHSLCSGVRGSFVYSVYSATFVRTRRMLRRTMRAIAEPVLPNSRMHRRVRPGFFGARQSMPKQTPAIALGRSPCVLTVLKEHSSLGKCWRADAGARGARWRVPCADDYDTRAESAAGGMDPVRCGLSGSGLRGSGLGARDCIRDAAIGTSHSVGMRSSPVMTAYIPAAHDRSRTLTQML